MSTLLKKSVIAASIILAVSSFINCDKKEVLKDNQTSLIAENNLDSIENYNAVYIRKPVVFITGIDQSDEVFYANARKYFQQKEYEIVEGQYSLEEIILWLNANVSQLPFGEIHIVNNSNPFEGLNLETVVLGEKVSVEALHKNTTEGTLPILQNVINQDSKIIFHATGLSENETLMKALKELFCTEDTPKVVASSYATIFGGKFSNYYLAESFYVFYPTANSPGKIDLSKEIARKYPSEKDINWYDTLQNNEERYVGEAYTTQFSVPILWEFDFHNSDNEIPVFTNNQDIIEWVNLQDDLKLMLDSYHIPAEKFRWTSSVKNSKLTIKGKTTALCVLKPLIKPYGDLKHIEPDTNNKRLYAMK
ncbi:hypothetical protein [Polaribacter sp.]|uniref:hypothetical protein n=1 Tax=Polaribacter sp. TaxID=1920175 RepID=UPI003EF60C72